MPELKPFISLIRRGEVVAFPTETVYGLGADAMNPAAVQKVFEIKGRPSDNPLIVHISDTKQLDQLVDTLPNEAYPLMKEFWPGPLTLVLNKKNQVPDLITAGLQTVAIRMPDHPLALEFISHTGPLVAPSANKSGRPSPTKASHVQNDLGTDFPVIDGGATHVGIESTVLDLTGATPSILRPGAVSRKQLESTLGVFVEESYFRPSVQPKSPGQKYSHYKPEANVHYGPVEEFKDGVLYLIVNPTSEDRKNIYRYDHDLEKLSRELYDRFRQADIQGYHTIHIEEIDPDEAINSGIFEALLNRILKASS